MLQAAATAGWSPPAQALQNIVHSLHELCSVFEERVRPAVARRQDVPGDGHDLAALFQRGPRGNERPALLGRLDDHDRYREAADDAVPQRKVLRPRAGAGWVLAHDRTRSNHFLGQVPMLRGIDDVGARTEHGNRRPPAADRAAMRRAVHASRQAAHDREASPRETLAEPLRHIQRVRRRRARPDEGDGRPGRTLTSPRTQRTGGGSVNGGAASADKVASRQTIGVSPDLTPPAIAASAASRVSASCLASAAGSSCHSGASRDNSSPGLDWSVSRTASASRERRGLSPVPARSDRAVSVARSTGRGNLVRTGNRRAAGGQSRNPAQADTLGAAQDERRARFTKSGLLPSKHAGNSQRYQWYIPCCLPLTPR